MLTTENLKKPGTTVPVSDGKNNVWYCEDCHEYVILRNWQRTVLCPLCRHAMERR